ncbi:MAG: hypothetical protein LIO68_00980 [Rikenellaceae bacterium]|nr:hypothetical protein [Rikenellaceae bacterium]
MKTGKKRFLPYLLPYKLLFAHDLIGTCTTRMFVMLRQRLEADQKQQDLEQAKPLEKEGDKKEITETT